MKKICALLLFFALAPWGLTAAASHDFAVTGIIKGSDHFVRVKLKNLSKDPVKITRELKEKIFLSLFINNIKRAEFKLKYIDPKLFRPGGSVLLRTNFRLPGGGQKVNIKVSLNPGKIIPERNYSNNTLGKRLTP